jgi:hypothetical protein
MYQNYDEMTCANEQNLDMRDAMGEERMGDTEDFMMN